MAVPGLINQLVTKLSSPTTVKNLFNVPFGIKMKYQSNPIEVNGNTVGTKKTLLKNLYPFSLTFIPTANNKAIGV